MKAIETLYRGIKYRSRTEARWAVFFDRLRVDVDYEPEGFDDGKMRYLPDFWVKQGRFWFEVKGIEPNQDEIAKAKMLATGSGHPVVIAVGAPSTGEDFNLRIVEPDGALSNAYFTDYGELLMVVRDDYYVSIVLRGNLNDLGGVPYPDLTAQIAKQIQAERFGVFDA